MRDKKIWRRWWSAPAKLNLFLHITGRLANGYHELQTVFQILEAGDSLRFSLRDDNEIVRSGGLAAVANHQDLTVRAAQALFGFCGVEYGVNIELDKRLPAGAGLGGGSSDAATTLLVLNELLNLKVPMEDLAAIGLQLGADVPVFLAGYSAWAEGVGEELQPLSLPSHYYIVATPSCFVDTGEVFSHPNLPRDTPRIKPFEIDFSTKNLPGKNDCEAIVKKTEIGVCKVADVMAEFGPVRLTGTGSSLFQRYENRAEAELVLQQLKGRLSAKDVRFLRLCKGVNQSPLLAELAAVNH